MTAFGVLTGVDGLRLWYPLKPYWHDFAIPHVLEENLRVTDYQRVGNVQRISRFRHRSNGSLRCRLALEQLLLLSYRYPRRVIIDARVGSTMHLLCLLVLYWDEVRVAVDLDAFVLLIIENLLRHLLLPIELHKALFKLTFGRHRLFSDLLSVVLNRGKLGHFLTMVTGSMDNFFHLMAS